MVFPLLFAANIDRPDQGCHRDAFEGCSVYRARFEGSAVLELERVAERGWFPDGAEGYVAWNETQEAGARNVVVLRGPEGELLIDGARFPRIQSGALLTTRAGVTVSAPLDQPERSRPVGSGEDGSLVEGRLLAQEREAPSLTVLDGQPVQLEARCGHHAVWEGWTTCSETGPDPRLVSYRLPLFGEPVVTVDFTNEVYGMRCDRVLETYPDWGEPGLVYTALCLRGGKSVGSRVVLAPIRPGERAETVIDLSAAIEAFLGVSGLDLTTAVFERAG